jgi:nitrous oxide reductase accessory protein NosL
MRAEKATYVLDSNLMTPMGFGIAAFADEEQARAMAFGQEDVMIMPFSELLAMNITMPDDLHAHEHQTE